jgi:hypothetical protein
MFGLGLALGGIIGCAIGVGIMYMMAAIRDDDFNEL